jgi:hypothetical protein
MALLPKIVDPIDFERTYKIVLTDFIERLNSGKKYAIKDVA